MWNDTNFSTEEDGLILWGIFQKIVAKLTESEAKKDSIRLFCDLLKTIDSKPNEKHVLKNYVRYVQFQPNKIALTHKGGEITIMKWFFILKKKQKSKLIIVHSRRKPTEL